MDGPELAQLSGNHVAGGLRSRIGAVLICMLSFLLDAPRYEGGYIGNRCAASTSHRVIYDHANNTDYAFTLAE
jgi:hypothetical protein